MTERPDSFETENRQMSNAHALVERANFKLFSAWICCEGISIP